MSTSRPPPADASKKKAIDNRKIIFRFCSDWCARRATSNATLSPADVPSSNLLFPQEDKENNRLMFACRTCAFSEQAPSACVMRHDIASTVGDTAGITQDVAQDPTVGVSASLATAQAQPATDAAPRFADDMDDPCCARRNPPPKDYALPHINDWAIDMDVPELSEPGLLAFELMNGPDLADFLGSDMHVGCDIEFPEGPEDAVGSGAGKFADHLLTYEDEMAVTVEHWDDMGLEIEVQNTAKAVQRMHRDDDDPAVVRVSRLTERTRRIRESWPESRPLAP